jgi:hypothetical protein
MGLLATIFPIGVTGLFLIGGGFLMGQGKYLIGVVTILGGLWVWPFIAKFGPKAQEIFASL